MKGLCCKLLCAYAESRDDGGSRFQRDRRSWFRVTVKSKTIMNTLSLRCHRLCALPQRHDSHVAGCLPTIARIRLVAGGKRHLMAGELSFGQRKLPELAMALMVRRACCCSTSPRQASTLR